MGLIYKITNKTNNKNYIGLTTRKFEDRWNEYKITYSKHSSKTSIFLAFEKYGIDNFYTEILEENIPNNKLDEKERFYIEKFNSFVPNGYNMTHGGRYEGTREIGRKNAKPVFQIDPTTYEIIDYASSISKMAEKIGTSPIRISDVCNRKHFTANGYIFRFEGDYLKAEIEDFINSKHSLHHIPVRAFYLFPKKYIGEYPSMYDASKELDISRSAITEYCQGKRFSAGKIRDKKIGFEYVNNEVGNIEAEEKRRIAQRKAFEGAKAAKQPIPIELYNIETNEIIEQFNDITDAINKYKRKGNIFDCLRGKRTFFTIENSQKLSFRLRNLE